MDLRYQRRANGFPKDIVFSVVDVSLKFVDRILPELELPEQQSFVDTVNVHQQSGSARSPVGGLEVESHDGPRPAKVDAHGASG